MTSEAELRGNQALQTGDWETARSELERALAAEETPTALDGMARGQAAAASQLLKRRLDQLGPSTLPAVPLLSLFAQARASESDPDGAQMAASQLAELAERTGLDRVVGLAALASARVATSESRTSEAEERFEAALAAFDRAKLPLETAVVRRELSRLWAKDRPELAIEEARTAHHGFDQLGARREADETAALLRSLGVRGQTGPKGMGQLSQREREVLELVAAGLTNAEIATRLFITTKTAGNHVSNVLMKLGVRSRTEASALGAKVTEWITYCTARWDAATISRQRAEAPMIRPVAP